MINLRTTDHPEANRRQPQPGEQSYTLTFPLESGDTLTLECGRETFLRFSDMIGRMLIDDAG